MQTSTLCITADSTACYKCAGMHSHNATENSMEVHVCPGDKDHSGIILKRKAVFPYLLVASIVCWQCADIDGVKMQTAEGG